MGHILFFIFIFFFNLSLNALPNRGVSSLSLGSAGTGRGAVIASEFNNLNPAGLVHLRNRFLGSTIQNDEYAISVSDNGTGSLFPAAVSYWKKLTKPNPQSELIESDISFATADFVKEKTSIGVSGHRFLSVLNGIEYTQLQMDLGLLFTMTDRLGFGLGLYNLISTPEDIPVDLQKNAYFGCGVNFLQNSQIRYSFDFKSDLSKPGNLNTSTQLALGVELFWNRWLALRFGVLNEQGPVFNSISNPNSNSSSNTNSSNTNSSNTNSTSSETSGSVGVGFHGPVFILGYAYYKNSHWLDFGVPF